MKNNYYLQEKYNDLLLELNILKKEESKIKEAYHLISSQHKMLNNDMQKLQNQIILLHNKNNKYLNDKTQKMSKVIVSSGITIAGLNFLFSLVSAGYLSYKKRPIINIISILMGEGIIGTLSIFTGISIILQIILVEKKKGRLKESSEYLKTASEIKKLNQEIEKEREIILKDDFNIFIDNIKKINLEVLLKEQEISNFEKTYANTISPQFQEKNSKPKTKTLVKQ